MTVSAPWSAETIKKLQRRLTMLSSILQKPVVAFEILSSSEEPTLEGTERLIFYRAEHEKSR